MKEITKLGIPTQTRSPGGPKPRSSSRPGTRPTPPKREVSYKYLRYVELKNKQLSQQVAIWTAIAFMVSFALLAVSTLAAWPE